MNGYFQIGCTPNGTILKIVKPTDGGEMVQAKEISDYLSSKKVSYSIGDIGKAVDALMASTKPEHLILLNRDQGEEIRESYILKTNSDKMLLTARFYPPSLKGGRLTAAEFINDLTVKGIKCGIEEDVIETFFKYPEYCTDIEVAAGKPVKEGEHARIEYYFDTDLSQKPELNEDGSVDFFKLKTFTLCKEGDILAKLYPAVKGEPGMTVFGEPIPPHEVKRKVIKHGRNLQLSEDGRILTALVSGHVNLVEEKVFLSNVLELDNVGAGTGNIDYDGNVVVLGNVLENFEVKATGTVEVKGVVEGAKIEAGEDIIIARGMKGMGKGEITAGRNVISKFFENSKVNAAGFVETDSILHSTVMAGTDIIVASHKGFITGGRVVAANMVRVKTLGSDMGADTIVEVGADPNVKRRIQELQKLISDTTRNIEQAKPTIENFVKKMNSGAQLSLDQKLYAKTLFTEDKERKANLELWKAEYEELEVVLENTGASCVEVTGDVYAGTKIAISDVSMTVKNTMTYCKFKKIDGDVKMTSL